MTFRSKTVPIILILLCGSVPVLFGLQLGWPGWVTVFPALALVAGLSLLVVRQSAGPEWEPAPYRPDPSPVTEPVAPPFGTGPVISPYGTGPMAPPEPPFNEKRVERVRLASARPDYTFVFSATVWWRPLRNGTGSAQPNLADLAESTVLSRAQAIAGQEDPERWESALRRIQGEIGGRHTDSSDLITVLADGISLTLDEDDRIRLEKLSQLRKEEDDWERHRDFERNRRAYLGDEVLKSPGSAVVWWFSRHDERIKDAVNMIGPLAQLSAAANDTDISEPFRHVVAGYPDRESYLAAMNGTDDAGTADDAEYGFRTPMPDAEEPPFGSDRGFVSPGGVDEGLRHTAYVPGEPGPFGATPKASGDVVDHFAEMLDALDLKEGSPERRTFVERIVLSTKAAGRAEDAERIKRRLNPDHCPPPEARPPFTDPAAPPPGDHGTPMDEEQDPAGRPGGPTASAPADDAPRGPGAPGPVTPEEVWSPGHRPEEASAAPTGPFDGLPVDGHEGQDTHEGRFTGARPAGEDADGGAAGGAGYAGGVGYAGGDGHAGGDARITDEPPAAPYSAPEAAFDATPDGSHGPAPQPSPFDAPEGPPPYDSSDRPADPRPTGHDPRHGYGTPPEQAPDGGYAPPPNDASPAGHTPGAGTVPPANGTPPTGDALWWGDRTGPSDGGPAAPPADPPAAPPPAGADSPDAPAAADRPEPPHDGGPQNPHTPGFG